MTDARNHVVKTPLQPKRAPSPASSFTSPPPKASLRKIRRPAQAMSHALKKPAAAPMSDASARSGPVSPNREFNGEAASPAPKSPSEKTSGIIRQSQSIKDTTTKTKANDAPTATPPPVASRANTQKNNPAIKASTSG